ncbi:MAG: winged helix-turn-helix transcriptional regulator [Actinobacteria bacterium]|nr:winged helix-turn-helix transcriptional regulator [Actinomycetota bacterium]
MTIAEEAAPPVHRFPNPLSRRFFQICTAATAAVVEPAGLTPLEFAVMAYVNSKIGEPDIDQTSLAARLGIDRNNTSLLVSSLEANGLLERRVSGTDRRVRLVRLTGKGEKLFAQLEPKALAGQNQLLDVLADDEREQFLDMLVRVIEANRALARPGAGRRKRNGSS